MLSSGPIGIQIEPTTAAKDIRIDIERSNAIESNDMTSIVPNKCHGLLHQLVVYIFNLIGINRIYKLKFYASLAMRLLLSMTCHNCQMPAYFRHYFELLKIGIPEFIIELLNVNPSCREDKNKLGRNFFFHAIQYRQAKVFNLIYGVTSSIRANLANVNDESGNTALHMAALLAPSEQLNCIPGAALQMQRELQWFKSLASQSINAFASEFDYLAISCNPSFSHPKKDNSAPPSISPGRSLLSAIPIHGKPPVSSHSTSALSFGKDAAGCGWF
ncbi:hypothetical protein L6164_008689 [Bauhinia variegata]|uniref:Uncharacterized protein n=1 Tax=Bauhinia variegata TaxID=167791 RepID=A0ACB9PHJ5_BAUVA|nr:hypothetical protein L6164_008689 [Bauhinia variegata]